MDVSCNWPSLDSCNTLAGLNAAGGTRTGGGAGGWGGGWKRTSEQMNNGTGAVSSHAGWVILYR